MLETLHLLRDTATLDDHQEDLVRLIKREDLYYNIRVMASQALSTLVPAVMANREIDKEHLRLFLNEAGHEVSALLSSLAPPMFHDALDITYEEIQKVAATA